MQNIAISDLVMDDGDKYTLLGNRVLLELDKGNKYFEISGNQSSIIMPDRFIRFVYRGTIRAIGKDVDNEQYHFEIGDKALFCSTLKGLNLMIDNAEYKVIAPYDIDALVFDKDVRPVMDRVLIKQTEQKQTSSLIIPDTVKQDTTKGVVVATGSGVMTDEGQVPLDVKIGDRVYFSKFSGMNLPISSEKHVLIKEENIFFIFEKGG